MGYAVGGRLALAEEDKVVMVKTVVTPKLTLAGVAFLSIQNEVKAMRTMKVAGM